MYINSPDFRGKSSLLVMKSPKDSLLYRDLRRLEVEFALS
jgi:hypothetical protein